MYVFSFSLPALTGLVLQPVVNPVTGGNNGAAFNTFLRYLIDQTGHSMPQPALIARARGLQMNQQLTLCVFTVWSWCDPFNLVQQALEDIADLVDLARDIFLSGLPVAREYQARVLTQVMQHAFDARPPHPTGSRLQQVNVTLLTAAQCPVNKNMACGQCGHMESHFASRFG